MNPSLVFRLGATIGMIGGSVFVLVNRHPLGTPWSTAALALWGVLLCVDVWAVWVRRARRGDSMSPPAPGAGRTYGLACLGMLGLIVAGSRIVDAMGHATAIPAVVAAAVGLHFLPFARAFRAPGFTLLGCALAAIGACGVAADLTLGAPAASAAAVLAGLVMLALLARDSLRPAR